MHRARWLASRLSPPWDRQKAGPFYGTVCNTTVAYAWGLPLVIRAKYIRLGQSYFLDDIGNDIDKVQLYDSYCYGGKGAHIILISGIGRDKDGKVQQIQIFEATGPCNRFKTFSREEFLEKQIAKNDGHFYRYNHAKSAPVYSRTCFRRTRPSPRFFSCSVSVPYARQSGSTLS